jgi:hypothetical protein
MDASHRHLVVEELHSEYTPTCWTSFSHQFQDHHPQKNWKLCFPSKSSIFGGVIIMFLICLFDAVKKGSNVTCDTIGGVKIVKHIFFL